MNALKRLIKNFVFQNLFKFHFLEAKVVCEHLY
jgi:hypothetical protein